MAPNTVRSTESVLKKSLKGQLDPEATSSLGVHTLTGKQELGECLPTLSAAGT